MEKLTDRLTAWAIRMVATAMLLAGVSALVAGVPLFNALAGSPVPRTIAGILLQISGVFVVAGGTAIYLSRPRGFSLPNERTATSDAERPDVGGWLIALAVVLVALPAWLVLQLRPFLAEWGRVADFLATSRIWEGANTNGSGLVLVPLAGALTPPLFELSALLAFVVASATLLMLLLSRSRRFPRLYLVCVVLLSALVIASVRSTYGAMLAAEAVQQLIKTSSATAAESAQLMEGLGRYTSIVRSTAPLLVWTLCGYLIWVPALIFSRRARTTFANSVGGRILTPSRAADLEAITSPPRFPG